MKMQNGAKLAGTLLKMERLRQNKEQKEVCLGICVPSYLSKIEHGTVCPDDKILAELFERLGILYEEDKEALFGYQKLIEKYFYLMNYRLDTKAVYQELKAKEEKLRYSAYAIDWLLIKSFENEEIDSMALLKELKEHMTAEQKAYYELLCSWRIEDSEERVRLCQDACAILNNSYAMLWLCDAYLLQGNYAAIHAMEQRIVAAAVEEGNTAELAGCFFLMGDTYACLNMEEMMMLYYERGIRLLQNTGWQNMLCVVYYNIGAVYISLKKYEPALEYLEKAQLQEKEDGEEPDIDILHKKAIACLRMGKKEEAQKFLTELKEALFSEEKPSEVDILKYEEAVMECRDGFFDDPAYLQLLEKLIEKIRKERHFGHLYFYRDVVIEAYKRQRKYKKALEFEEQISSNIIKNGI